MTTDQVVTGHLYAAGFLEKVKKICSPQNHCFSFKLGYLITASARPQIRLNFDRNVAEVGFQVRHNLKEFRI